MNILVTRKMKSLALGFAALAMFTLNQSVARADCVITVANNALVIANGNATVPPIIVTTTFAGNALTNTLTQSGPATFGANIGPLTGIPNLSTLLANSTNTIGITLVGAGTAFNPNPLNLVGTLNVNALTGNTISFAPGTFTIANAEANICATFSVTVNEISVAALLNGGALTANFQEVICGTCTGPGGVPGTGVAPVPEPTTMLLLGTGLAGIAAKVRKRRNAGQIE